MQQPWGSREQDQRAKIVPLQAPKKGKNTSFRHLGALLAEVRRDSGVSQQEIASAFEHYCTKNAFAELHLQWSQYLEEIKPLTAKQYGKIERNEQAPRFAQLLSLYLAMTAGCGVEITPEERDEFLELARRKIERKTRQYREILSPEDWQWLEEQLRKADGDGWGTQQGQIRILEDAQSDEEELTRQAREQRVQVLSQLEKDTSHVLGRDAWLEKMLLYLEQETTPRKKVIIVTAMIGVGKSSSFKLLHKHLLKTEHYPVILHECKEPGEAEPLSSQEEKTPAEHLDTFLAHILNDLQPQQAERHEASSVQERIRLVLEAIRERTTRLVVLIDDAQVLLERNGELSAGWQQFLKALMEHEHRATLYVATREWPGWAEREDTYIAQTRLEPLSPETCIQLWRNLGFVDEQEAILRKATDLCGGNPRMIEIVAQNVEKPIFSFGWSNWQTTAIGEQQGLARFVDDPHCLSNAMLDAYPLLDEIISTRLSPDAQQLLTTLAVSPLPLPAPLLIHLVQHPRRCIKELVRISLLARDPDRLCLLPLVTESILQQLSPQERIGVEKQLIIAYQHWLQEGGYRSEQEQAAAIAELVILYLKHLYLLEAAELVIGYGWLSFQFGHASRIARIAQQIMNDYNWQQTPQHELAGYLLQYRLARYRGEKVNTQQRGEIYQQLRQRAKEEQIYLSPTIEIYLMKPIVISLADGAQFEAAQALISEQLTRVKPLQESDPAAYASYLYYHAYLLAKWAEHEEDLAQEEQDPLAADRHLKRARALFGEAAALYKQCIDLLRGSERGAAPIKKSTIRYKLARHLNDYAHYARRSGGKFEDIEEALRESIDLKGRGYTLPISLPVTLAEYAQFFMSTGQYQKACEQSDLALQQMQQLVQGDYPTAKRELAILQIERGELHLLQGNLDDAQQLFEQAKEFVQNSVRRKQFKRRVEEGLQTIERIRGMVPTLDGALRGQLDYRWLNRYKGIADYDTFWWLEPSGPFTAEEQREWTRLASQEDQSQKTKDALKSLVKTALQRELDTAVEEQRDPHIMYPVIPIDLVRQKIAELDTLRSDIENEEPNVIVKSLYLGAIDEHLDLLHLIEACNLGNSQAFSFYNNRLNATPTAQEMEIATQELVKILKKGMASEQTAPLSQKLFRTLQELLLVSPYRDIAKEYAQEHKQNFTGLQRGKEASRAQEQHEENPLLSIDAVKDCFESVFSLYGFDDWSVKLDLSTLNTRVEPNTRELILPKKSLRLDKVLHLLAHEIECHIYRFANGQRSKLALLGYGTANFLATEEAFATLYSAQAEQKEEPLPWIGTFAAGLASGAKRLLGGKIEAQNFHELYCIMRDYHQLNLMLNGKDTEVAERSAHRLALSRCLRTWRGAPSPLQPGTCFTKDNCYLRGYLVLQQEVEHARNNGIDLIERLRVGAIGVEHVHACEQLGITRPIIAHKRLAFDPQIRQYILSFQASTKTSAEVTLGS